MFTTPEEKLYLENLLFAIQNIGSGADPSLEKAKLRLGALNAAVEINRHMIDAGNDSEMIEDQVLETASRLESYVLGSYADAALARFAVPVPPFKPSI
jgi:hypothetical protein